MQLPNSMLLIVALATIGVVRAEPLPESGTGHMLAEVHVPPVPDEQDFRMLTWNVHLSAGARSPNGQVQRVEMIPDYLAGYDAVALTEAWNDEQRDRLSRRIASEYPYRTQVLAPGSPGKSLHNGGVIVFSRWPITATDQRGFESTCYAGDCELDKGVLYARIDRSGRVFHVFATHTQSDAASPSDSHEQSTRIRQAQFEIVRGFIRSRNIAASEPVLIAGTLNVDRYTADGRYQAMLQQLDAAGPDVISGPRYTYDGLQNPLADGVRQRYVDYILCSRAHLQPGIDAQSDSPTFVDEVKVFRTARRWNAAMEQISQKGRHDLSDHYAQSARMQFRYPEQHPNMTFASSSP